MNKLLISISISAVAYLGISAACRTFDMFKWSSFADIIFTIGIIILISLSCIDSEDDRRKK